MKPFDAELIILANQSLGRVQPRLFGQFIELAGRCINHGLYDPESPLARHDGLRPDVIRAIRELRPGYLRYPGGCAVAYFNWQELVGPPESRPAAKLFRDAGGQVQATAFGIPEAYALCQELGAELYLTVNAHTQSPEDAANLVEYLNGTTATKYANLRRSHGRDAPYNIKLFSLGNEIYGNWQPGQKTAAAYAEWCAEAIQQMKLVDPEIQIVVCGLGRPDPEWDRTVLFRLIGLADMISVHNYFGRPVFADLMAASCVAEQLFTRTQALIDEAMDLPLGTHSRVHRQLGALPVVTRRPGIAFDEWNMWYRTGHHAEADLEEVYHYTDALATATILHAILRQTQAIDLAGISLAVNTLGTIRTDAQRMVRQSIWYAQKLIRDAHAGKIVRTIANAPTFAARHERFFCGIVDPEKAGDDTLPSLVHFKDIPALDAVASIDDATRTLTLSIVQKLEKQSLNVHLDLHDVTPTKTSVVRHRLSGGEIDPFVTNTLDHPDRIGIETDTIDLIDPLPLPPASLTVLELKLQ